MFEFTRQRWIRVLTRERVSCIQSSNSNDHDSSGVAKPGPLRDPSQNHRFLLFLICSVISALVVASVNFGTSSNHLWLIVQWDGFRPVRFPLWSVWFLPVTELAGDLWGSDYNRTDFSQDNRSTRVRCHNWQHTFIQVYRVQILSAAGQHAKVASALTASNGEGLDIIWIVGN